MCGVIGIRITAVDEHSLTLVRNVFRQTMIRGKHATGVTFLRDGKLNTIKEGIPVTEFLQKYDPKDWVDADGSMTLVGHIRYSTSDLRYNQPFANKSISIVHNGVLNQNPSSEWEYATETQNDSEMILHAIMNKHHPLEKFADRSMAVCTLDRNGMLSGFRNHERPLWYTMIDNGIVFTSTKDIALRSGLKSPQKCEMFTHYLFSNDVLSDKKYEQFGFNDLQ